MSAPLKARLSQFAERRLPALTRERRAEPLPVMLHRRRIYIVPTAYGLGFAVLLAVMLVGALNYTNNAALLLTCLLGGTAVNSMLATFRSLDGVRLDHVDTTGPVLAGDEASLRLHLSAPRRARFALRLEGPEIAACAISLPADTAHIVTVHVPTARRGWRDVPRLRLSSRWPFGLFQAWSWLRPRTRILVWPRAEAYGPPPPGHGDEVSALPTHGDEYAALRDYRIGDPRKHIAWKASARHHDLLVRDMQQPPPQHGWRLDWHALGGMEREQRIARLARWLRQAHDEGRRWSLSLPGLELDADSGSAHFRRGMNALAELP